MWEHPANSSDRFSWRSPPVGVIVNVIYCTPCLGQEPVSLRRESLTALEEATFSWGLRGNVLTVFRVFSG